MEDTMGPFLRKMFRHFALLLVFCITASWGCYVSTGRDGRADVSFDSLPDAEAERQPDPGEEAVIGGCGNGIVEGTEQCDDGNRDGCDGCSSSCRWERAMRVDAATPGASSGGASVPCLTCPFTVEAWFKVDEGNGLFCLFDIPGFIAFGLSTTEYEFRLGDGAGGGGVLGPIGAGTWHHLAVSCGWRGGSWDMFQFVDGEALGGGQGWSEAPSWTCEEPMSVGCTNAIMRLPLPFLPGTIDDLRISNQGLYSIEEPFVPEKYLGVRPDTVALWQFNAQEGDVIRDASGHGYDVVLESGILVADECHTQ
jgi:cysteine-rich repeat protein